MEQARLSRTEEKVEQHKESDRIRKEETQKVLRYRLLRRGEYDLESIWLL